MECSCQFVQGTTRNFESHLPCWGESCFPKELDTFIEILVEISGGRIIKVLGVPSREPILLSLTLAGAYDPYVLFNSDTAFFISKTQ